MTNNGNRPGRAGRGPRSRLDDRDDRLARKRRQTTTGLIRIPGPLSATRDLEIRRIAARATERERRREPDAHLTVEPFEHGLAIETSSEKLAQHLADALARSQNGEVVRKFDDGGRRRVLTVRLPFPDVA